MTQKDYVIGVDYGTDSVRSILVDAADGKELSSAVHRYTRWSDGKYCDAGRNQFRQHPLDYIEGLELTVRQALAQASAGASQSVRGISIDTTGSTPVAVDSHCTPLALLPEFENNPNAMFILWKDHTAIEEAGELNRVAKTWGGIDFTKYVGGVYSSEWFWAKLLHVLRRDKRVRKAAFSWVEHCDWIPALLTGAADPLAMKRSRCAAGHKAMWHASFGGLPSEEFLVTLDPLLMGLRSRLFEKTYTCDQSCGTLTPEWSRRLGLPQNVVVGAGSFDAHMGAVGGQIEPYVLTKIVGTSTCDMLIAPMDSVGDKLISGICGQVDGSIVPGMLGMEAGQSCVGDVYAWYKNMIVKQVERVLRESGDIPDRTLEAVLAVLSEKMVDQLSKDAEALPIGESGIVSLDWLNGRRTPYANQLLRGAVTGLNLSSDAPRIFRSLVEATAFGARKIVDRFVEEGISIKGVIALGGVAKKSPFVMQAHADALDMPIKVARSEQACALGAAMCAAVAAGIYSTVQACQNAMGNGFENEYRPIPDNVKHYAKLYARYSKLGDFVEKELTE
jgi:L-ribulokinase